MVSRALVILSLSVLLAACGSSPKWYDNPDTHIVRKGETLYSIAFRYGKKPEDLARWNRLGNGSLIYPGQSLRLTPPSGSTRTTASKPGPAPKPLPKIPDQPSPKWAECKER